ncbi:hypothetical protein McpSp1_13460 [Methanocorpusculaceae archaeon Sp1]|nr:hypothetical protein [Methanocorpusculaceae archaeon Sp1]
MKKLTMILIAAVVLALFAGAASASTAVGGDRGVIQVSCDVDGATVVLVSVNGDESEPQTIVNGQTEFSVYTTGTPYTQVKVSAPGYQTATVPVTMPAKGETSSVTVTLTPEEPMGGDRGVIQVKSNVNGATVELISVSGTVAETGTIKDGQAEFAVYATGTPITQVRVSAAGYQTATKPLDMPASGKTTVVDVPLTPNPTPTSSPMGIAVLGLLGAVAAVVLLRRD